MGRHQGCSWPAKSDWLPQKDATLRTCQFLLQPCPPVELAKCPECSCTAQHTTRSRSMVLLVTWSWGCQRPKSGHTQNAAEQEIHSTRSSDQLARVHGGNRRCNSKKGFMLDLAATPALMAAMNYLACSQSDCSTLTQHAACSIQCSFSRTGEHTVCHTAFQHIHMFSPWSAWQPRAYCTLQACQGILQPGWRCHDLCKNLFTHTDRHRAAQFVYREPVTSFGPGMDPLTNRLFLSVALCMQAAA